MGEALGDPLRLIVLADHDPAWAEVFAREAARIRDALGPVRVEHAGSTAVPGLAAKPIVDVVLEVPDAADEAAYVPALEAAGYRFFHREPHWFEHRLLKRASPEVNLHVFGANCEEVERMLRFRDRLRASEADRRRYEEAKRALAAREWQRVQDYADAKTDVIAEILARA